MTLALGQAHFPEDWVHDEITSGWPSEMGEVNVFEVVKQQDRAAPFADRVRRMDGLMPFLPTKVPEGDSPVEPRDLPSERPIEDARQGKLTTFKTEAMLLGRLKRAPPRLRLKRRRTRLKVPSAVAPCNGKTIVSNRPIFSRVRQYFDCGIIFILID